MAVEITVYPLLSPRIIQINSPATTCSIQELVDAVRAWEDTTYGQDFPFLIDAAGKEDLGGGVSVAITAELQNARVMFQSRKTPTCSGTITTIDTSGLILTDSAADFISDGVTPGAEVYNDVDGSSACVLDVISATQLQVDYLGGGIDNQWEIGDGYVIWNQIVCELYGGNVVAVNDLGASIEPVLPSFGTYVKAVAASSATLVDSGGGITVQAIVNGVWDELNASHLIPGSTGESLSDAAAGGAGAPTAAEIADAVWDENPDAHRTNGTFGEWIRKILYGSR